MTTNWTMLLNGYGYEVTEVKPGVLDLQKLTMQNRDFLFTVIEPFSVYYSAREAIAEMDTEVITESSWISRLEKFVDGTTESSFAPTEIPLHKIDVYIAGIVMQLNRLGCVTLYSCDGHKRRRPFIHFQTTHFARIAKNYLEHFGLVVRRISVTLIIVTARENLPYIAMQMAALTTEHAQQIIEENEVLLCEQAFEKTVETVLNIPGESENEGFIRSYVINELTPYVDDIAADHYGNVVAVKKFGSGPTILLNAHLDTYEMIVEGRAIIKEGAIWSSSDGILGADDRAGVAVVLAVAKSIKKDMFHGTIKYIFTVEEEIGLRGARQVAKSFLWGVDMAFVIDRRGTNDIVTSSGSYDLFCTTSFGTALESIGKSAGFDGWKTVVGGSSDTRVWAQSGIESVNLSAGYENEHTCEEQLDIKACYETYQFVMEIIHECRPNARLARHLRSIALKNDLAE